MCESLAPTRWSPRSSGRLPATQEIFYVGILMTAKFKNKSKKIVDTLGGPRMPQTPLSRVHMVGKYTSRAAVVHPAPRDRQERSLYSQQFFFESENLGKF